MPEVDPLFLSEKQVSGGISDCHCCCFLEELTLIIELSERISATNLKDAEDTILINKEKFLLEAKDKEGYLFPDTYFFFTTKFMKLNFKL